MPGLWAICCIFLQVNLTIFYLTFLFSHRLLDASLRSVSYLFSLDYTIPGIRQIQIIFPSHCVSAREKQVHKPLDQLTLLRPLMLSHQTLVTLLPTWLMYLPLLIHIDFLSELEHQKLKISIVRRYIGSLTITCYRV